MYLLLVLAAGLLQGAMGSLNGLLGDHIGIFGVSLLSHAVGIRPLGLYFLFIIRQPIRWGFGRVPPYVYTAGFMGALITAISSYCVFRLGAAITACVGAAAQLVMSAAVDHFGWFGGARTAFDPRRIPGILLILAGVVLLNLG